MLPSIKIRPLNLLSASFVNLHGITNSDVFHKNLRIRLSPLKSHILRKYTNPFKRCGMYPSISKCNAKRCKCCKHVSTKRFDEHYRRMNKPKIDNFLYRHFKRKGHTPANILVQPVEKITHDANSTSRVKIIKRHETELKWIKLLQTPYPLGFCDNIYHNGNHSKMPNFDVFSLSYS